MQSELDALTQLPNRYRLNEVCEKLFRKALMNHLTFGILILDVDYFKEYNDYHGHLEGDQCICKVAKTIKECAKGLFCSRFGGDEFFIVSINKQEDELYEIAQTIQTRVQEMQMEHPKGLEFEYVTVSQGICVEIPQSGQTFADFTHAADMALYRGKDSTRNSIFVGSLDFQ
jgi:diguanylate cyclase (GGDEF)-like protein